MSYFSAICGDVPVVVAAKFASQFGMTIEADGDLNCYRLVKSRLAPVVEFTKRRQHTLGMIHLNGRIVVPEDK